MPAFQAPRGTRDLLPADQDAFTRLESIAAGLAARYGYRAMDTPMFEQAQVFERGVGEVTDIVEKELFRLQPRTETGETETWALRPEATAGIVRAYIQHGLKTLPQPVKVSLIGPMFRYDRPQAGRYRQFRQFDAEAIGDPGPAVDAELIELGLAFYREAGLVGTEVLLNSIGDPVCRPAYLRDLVTFYEAHRNDLPEVERARLGTNPLRLLDSKAPIMVRMNADAPRLVDRLCDACAEHFTSVRTHLEAIGVPYRLEAGLVRGLDYYTRTAFEYYQPGAEGQQSALGGGGRYDGLVALLGGQPTPGIGFALGLDRVVLALRDAGITAVADAAPLAVVVGADPAATAERLRLATDLRAAGLAVRAELAGRKLGRQLEGAAREGAHFAVIIGDEMAEGHVQLRDLEAGTQRSLPVAELARELKRAGASHHHG